MKASLPSFRTPLRSSSCSAMNRASFSGQRKEVPSPLSPNLMTPRQGGEMRSGVERIKVYARVRDFQDSEIQGTTAEEAVAVQINEATCVVLETLSSSINAKTKTRRTPFTFDQCFSSAPSVGKGALASQEDVYNAVGKPLVDNALSGYNSSFIVYGQTGSGKTHTVYGPPNALGSALEGLIPRVCNEVFARQQASAANIVIHDVSVSLCEVYQERVYDLLSSRRQALEVGGETTVNGFFVRGLQTTTVGGYSDVVLLLQQAEQNKSYGATAKNERSSRAHTLFTMDIVSSSPESGAPKVRSKIVLADLAGCENVKTAKSDTNKELFQEARNINASLSALRICIEKATRAKPGMVIPEFRNSVLTKLLYDSICGNSRCTILATLSPHARDVTTSLQALSFVNDAKSIKTHANVTMLFAKPIEKLRAQHKLEIEELHESHLHDTARLKSDHQALVNAKEEEKSKLQLKIHALETELASLRRDGVAVDCTPIGVSPMFRLAQKGVDLVCSTARRIGGRTAASTDRTPQDDEQLEEHALGERQACSVELSPITQLPEDIDPPQESRASEELPLVERLAQRAAKGCCVSCGEKVLAHTRCRRCNRPVHVKMKECASHKTCQHCRQQKQTEAEIGDKRKRATSQCSRSREGSSYAVKHIINISDDDNDVYLVAHKRKRCTKQAVNEPVDESLMRSVSKTLAQLREQRELAATFPQQQHDRLNDLRQKFSLAQQPRQPRRLRLHGSSSPKQPKNL